MSVSAFGVTDDRISKADKRRVAENTAAVGATGGSVATGVGAHRALRGARTEAAEAARNVNAAAEASAEGAYHTGVSQGKVFSPGHERAADRAYTRYADKHVKGLGHAKRAGKLYGRAAKLGGASAALGGLAGGVALTRRKKDVAKSAFGVEDNRISKADKKDPSTGRLGVTRAHRKGHFKDEKKD